MGQAPRVRVLEATTPGRTHRLQEGVYRVLTLVRALVVEVPILRQAQDDEPGAAAPVLDGAVREAAARPRGALRRVECDGAIGRRGAAGVGGPGAWELDESSVGEPVGTSGRGRGVLAAASARWVSPGRGRQHRVLAPALAGVSDQPRPRDSREGLAGDPRRDHRADRERGDAAVRAAAGPGAGCPGRSEPERASSGAAEASGGPASPDRGAGHGSGVRPELAEGSGRSRQPGRRSG